VIQQGGHNFHVPLLASDKKRRCSIRLQGHPNEGGAQIRNTARRMLSAEE
jgi:hypothetical protein